jgi:hypothetical protein
MPRSCKRPISLKFPHQNPLYTSPFFPYYYMPHPPHSSGFYHSNNIWCWMQIVKLITLPSPPWHCHFIPLRPKYSAQHPILQHPQPTFFPQGKRPSFTTIWKKQNYNSVSFNLYIFRKQTGKQKIWVWMAAGISWAQSALNSFITAMLTCYGCLQIFVICHPSNGFITYLYAGTLSCISFMSL